MSDQTFRGVGATSVTVLVAVLVSPAAFRTLTVTRVRILRLSFRILKLRFDSVILRVTVPLVGTENDLLASVIFLLSRVARPTRTRLRLLKVAVPLRVAVAWKLNLTRRLLVTRIDDFGVSGRLGGEVAG